jgi:hypothetical protein
MAEHVPYVSKGMGKQFCTAEGVEWPCEAEKQRLRADAAEEKLGRTRRWIEQNLAVWSDDEETRPVSKAVCDLLRKVRNVMDTGHPLASL